jgi:hypothetical protein
MTAVTVLSIAWLKASLKVFVLPLIIIKISVSWALKWKMRISQAVDKVDVANTIIIRFRRLRCVVHDAL